MRPTPIVIVACLLAVVPLPSDAAQPPDLKCRRAILNQGSAFVQERLDALQICEDRKLEGRLSAATDCVTEPMTAAKIATASSKLAAEIGKECGGADKACGGGDDLATTDPVASGGIGFPATCPNLANGACVNAIAADDCTGVVTCLECVHTVASDQAIALAYGSLVPADPVADAALNECQRTIGEQSIRFLLFKENEIRKCWDTRFKGDHASSCPVPGFPAGKTPEEIAKAEAKMVVEICDHCGGADGRCDQTVTLVNDALGNSIAGSGGTGANADLAPAAIGFPATCEDVTVPVGGTLCSGPVGTLADLNFCLACANEFRVDCLALVQVPQFEPYPMECNACGDGVASGGESCDPPGSPTCGGLLEECTATCQCPCPSRFQFDMNDDDTLLDRGWTGVGHNAPWLSDARITVEVTGCESPGKPCGDCAFSGPIPNAGGLDYQRCAGDTSVSCEADSDCAPAAGPCRFFLSSNVPYAAGGVATCVLPEIDGPTEGVGNIETGQTTSLVRLRWHVFAGSAVDQPCPQCVGDGPTNDGRAEGTCSDGARASLPCDANGGSPFDAFGRTSLDCPPGTPLLAELPLTLPNSTGTEALVLNDESPHCTAAGLTDLPCMCDTCADTAGTPCMRDTDCAAPFPGICGGLRCLADAPPAQHGTRCAAAGPDPACLGGTCGRPGVPTQPNACTDGTCTPVGGNEGACSAGPVDLRCSPAESFRACTVDGDCPVPGDTCLPFLRPCFLDDGVAGQRIVADGSTTVPMADASIKSFASVFCMGPTSSAVDGVVGLPGASRLAVGGIAIGLPPLRAPVNPCAGLPDGTPCDDGDPCTQADACLGEVCGGGPPFLIAERGRVGNRGTVEGDLAVNADGGLLSLGRDTFTSDGTTTSADRLRLGAGASVADVAYNELSRGAERATIRGVETTPLGVPVLGALPALAGLACGGPDVIVPRGGAVGPLAPGSYDRVVVKRGGTLTLASGVFAFCKVRAATDATIEVTGGVQTVVDVREDLRMSRGGTFGPVPGTPTPVLNVLNRRETGGRVRFVRFSRDATIEAFLTAPDAIFRLGRDVTVNGTFFVRSLVTDRRVTLMCEPA